MSSSCPPFDLGGRPFRSSEIRDLIRAGDLGGAARVARPAGHAHGDGDGGLVVFELPMAIPPDGRYAVTVDGSPSVAEVAGGVDLPADARRPDLGRFDRTVAIDERPGRRPVESRP